MNVYVFEYIDQVSDNYHSEGGLMVVAQSVERAQELIDAESNVEVTSEEWAEVIVIKAADTEQERLIVFPDAGCC